MILLSNDNGVLIDLQHDPLYGMEREEFQNVLKNALSGRVEEAWLFGSFAENKMHRFSDIDLILIVSTELPMLERARAFDDLYEIGPQMDILVYTPEEFFRLMNQTSPGFWTSVKEQLLRLI